MFNVYEKESFKVTIIPSWDSADAVQYINICRHDTIHTVHWLADNIYVHFCVQLYTLNIFLKISSWRCSDTMFLLWILIENITFFQLPYLDGLVWIEGWVHPPLNFQCVSTSGPVFLKGLSHEIEMNYKWYNSTEPK